MNPRGRVITLCLCATLVAAWLASPGCVTREVRSKSYGGWSALGDRDVERAPTVQPQPQRATRVRRDDDDDEFDPLGDMWRGIKDVFDGDDEPQVRRMKIERKMPSEIAAERAERADDEPLDAGDDAPTLRRDAEPRREVGGSDIPPLFD